MGKYSRHRGHKIEEIDGVFYFADTGKSVADTWRNRPCGKCGQHNTPEGHDACLGSIPNVMNACCGHGDYESAYIQYTSGTIIRGAEVIHALKGTIEDAQELWDAHCDEARALIRAELKRIARKIVKQAIYEMISSGALFQNSQATAHPKYQSHPKRPRA